MSRRSALRAAALVAAGIAVAGSASAPAAPRPPARLLVTATEFRFGLSRTTVVPGKARVQLANRGEDGHDLAVRRLDRRGRSVPGTGGTLAETQPGAVGTLAVALRPGRYVLSCTLRGHRAAGMRARLTVR
jgi:plastocyanin